MYPRLNATVTVRQSQVGPSPSLSYSVVRHLHSSAELLDPLTPSPPIEVIQSDKNEEVMERMQRIAGTLTYNPLSDSAALIAELQAVGRFISERLLPIDCFKCCEGNFPRTIELMTDQNDVPWEIAMLGGKFLSERAIHTRYPFVGRGRRLPFSYAQTPRLLIITGRIINLPNANVEVTAIKDVYKTIFPHTEAHTINSGEITSARLRSIFQFGERGVPYDIVHFIGHGGASGNQVWLELPGGAFLPDDIPHSIIGNPLVFWNACFSASAPAFAPRYQPEVVSAFGARLIANGAGHFIGSLIPLQDGIAKEFAGSFYQSVFQGQTVGEAFFDTKSRLAAGAPLVHTYALYGSPTVRIKQNA